MIKFISLILIIAGFSCTRAKVPAGSKEKVVYPDSAKMKEVYEELKTPYKYGIILKGEVKGLRARCGCEVSLEWTDVFLYVEGSVKPVPRQESYPKA